MWETGIRRRREDKGRAVTENTLHGREAWLGKAQHIPEGCEQPQGKPPRGSDACAEMVQVQTQAGDDEVGSRKTHRKKKCTYEGPGVDASTPQPMT